MFLEAHPQMARMYKALIIILALFSLGAVCEVEPLQYFITQNSDTSLDDQSHIDYVLVIDRSGSMRVGNRFEEATNAAREFVSSIRSDDRVAIVGFDSRSRIYTELTNDKQEALQAIDRISIGDFTQYNQALSAATDIFRSDTNDAQRVVIFLSDGKPDDSSAVLQTSINSVLGQEACLYTIAYADEADQQAQVVLEDIASQSSQVLSCGEYFRAQEDSYDLQRIYDQIFDLTTQAEIFDVQTSVNRQEGVRLDIEIFSLFNQQNLDELACFDPHIELVLLRDNQVLSEQVVTDRQVPISLPQGEYSYVVRVIETCGSNCVYTGVDEGEFAVTAADAACAVTAQELAALVSSSEQRVIEITGQGFSPSTVGTDGVVTWRNVDSVNHKVIGLNGDFESPLLRPGDEWSYAFSPGEYTFVDAQGILSGNIRSAQTGNIEPADLILVLDNSGSMAGEALVNAKSASQTLLGLVNPGDRASFIVFSDAADVIQQLTSDISLLQSAVSSVRSQGATRYIPPLELVGEQLDLSRGDRQRLVMFLSDGAPSESDKEILSTLDDVIGDACLYTIGYGEEGVQAVNLLSRMADDIQEKNDCGLFYYSEASEQELAQVFGEIYALSTRQQIVFEDLQIDTSGSGEVSISTRARTETGRELPYQVGNLCLPSADIEVIIGEQRFPLSYDGEKYSAQFTLDSGSYQANLFARLVPLDRPEQTIVGTQQIDIKVTSWTVYIYALLALALLVFVSLKVFIRRQPPSNNDYRYR